MTLRIINSPRRPWIQRDSYVLRGRRPYNVLTAKEFERKYQEIFDKHDIRKLLIFGYTYETVRDYQKYDHLYVDG